MHVKRLQEVEGQRRLALSSAAGKRWFVVSLTSREITTFPSSPRGAYSTDPRDRPRGISPLLAAHLRPGERARPPRPFLGGAHRQVRRRSIPPTSWPHGGSGDADGRGDLASPPRPPGWPRGS